MLLTAFIAPFVLYFLTAAFVSALFVHSLRAGMARANRANQRPEIPMILLVPFALACIPPHAANLVYGIKRNLPESAHVWDHCVCVKCRMPRFLQLNMLDQHDWGEWTRGRGKGPNRPPEGRTCRRCGCRHLRGEYLTGVNGSMNSGKRPVALELPAQRQSTGDSVNKQFPGTISTEGAVTAGAGFECSICTSHADSKESA